MKRGLGTRWAIALFVLMLLLAGCSQNNGGESGTPAASGGTETPASSSTGSDEKSAEPKGDPITLTYGTYDGPTDTIDNFVDTPVGQQILKELNIIVKIRGSQNADQDFTADVAADNLPDIVAFGVNSIRPQIFQLAQRAAEQGLLVDLNDALKKEGPLLTEVLKPERMPLFMRNFIFDPSFEGKTYFLPDQYSTTEPTLNGFGLYIRGDIAKALNVDPNAVRTADDLYNLAKKIKEGGFKDINGKDVYPIGTMPPIGATGVWPQVNYSLFRSFDYGSTGVALVDGKLQGYADSEQAWEQISFARKLIAEGLFDPEAVAHTLQIGTEKVAQGRYAILPLYAARVVAGWQEPMKSLTDANPDMEYVALAPLNDYQGSSIAQMNIGGEGAKAIAVSKGANAEAAVRLLNWLNTKDGRATALYGAKGEHWDYNDKGFARMTDEAYAQIIADLKGYTRTVGGDAFKVGPFITGFSDAKYDIFGGDTRNRYYQNNPTFIEKTNDYLKVVMSEKEIANKFTISNLIDQFPGKDRLQPVLQQQNEIFGRTYLIKSENEAKAVWEGYRETLNKNGYQDYIKFLQEKYDAEPDSYAVFVSNL